MSARSCRRRTRAPSWINDARRILVADDVGIRLAVHVRVVAHGELRGADDRSAWFVTTVPFVMLGASVTSNWIWTELNAGRLKLRMSRTPAPFVPALGFVFDASAPGGSVPATIASEPGTNTAAAFERAEVVVEPQVVERDVRALQPQRVAQRVAGRRRRRGVRAGREVRDGLLEEVAVQRDGDRVRVLVIGDARRCRSSACGCTSTRSTLLLVVVEPAAWRRRRS